MSKISVIVPIYNSEKFLCSCIESVLNQNYSDFELILIDDGSTDNSLNVCESYTDERIKIIHQENQGEAAARNTGLKFAAGDYVAFLDSDDWWNENFLSQMISGLKHHKKIPVCSFVRVSTDGTEKNCQPLPSENLPDLLTLQYSLSCCRCLFERKILLQKNIYFTSGRRTGEDQEFTYKYILNTNGLLYVSEAKYFYRVNPSSIMFKAGYGHFDAVEAMKSLEKYAVGHCDESLALEIKKALRLYKYPYLIEFSILTLLAMGERPKVILSYLRQKNYDELLDQSCADKLKGHKNKFMMLWKFSKVFCLRYYYARKQFGNLLRKIKVR